MIERQAPRGIRNNNPGNIRHSASKWQGMTPDQPDAAFVRFVSPEMGIRALARTLLTYQTRHGLDTIARIIGRWAPPDDGNDTGAYARHVAERLGVGVNEHIDVADHLPRLVAAIIVHENGQCPYPTDVIARGCDLAREA